MFVWPPSLLSLYGTHVLHYTLFPSWYFPSDVCCLPLPPAAPFSRVPADESIHLNPILHEPPEHKHRSQRSDAVVSVCIASETPGINGEVMRCSVTERGSVEPCEGVACEVRMSPRCPVRDST